MAADRTFLGCLLEAGVLRTKRDVSYVIVSFTHSLQLGIVLTYQIVFLAVNPPVNVVERFAPQRSSTGTAYKAICVIKVSPWLGRLDLPQLLSSPHVWQIPVEQHQSFPCNYAVRYMIRISQSTVQFLRCLEALFEDRRTLCQPQLQTYVTTNKTSSIGSI